MKFWQFKVAKNKETETVERELRLEGIIAEESWWNDEVSPKDFKQELYSGQGDIKVWINSPGGDVFAAAQIYNMLKEYKGKVTIIIDALAASAASVIAMSGDEVHITPVGMMMLHNPYTIAIGDSAEMLKVKHMLDEVKESIINAYNLKTKLPRQRLNKLMEDETWLNANKAIELGFADKIMYSESEQGDKQNKSTAFSYSPNAIWNKIIKKAKYNPEYLYDRLNLIKPMEVK
jgi:ATP-dependent Clp protease protease subunit